MDGSNIVKDKAERFAIRIVKCSRYIRDKQREYSLADQLLRSGTSIGANLSEAEFAQSKADFITKLSISLKEAAETKFWLKLLHKTDLLEDKMFYSMYTDVKDIISLLVTILRKLKGIDNNEKSEHRQ
ncbi:MAG TPA: four helix bundle protein [Candidatus Prevotella stercoripullorum]|nr:four helix bundle protein [Candidatus Prevotella stercoripullorum]